MADARFAVETLARDGLGREARAVLAGREFTAPVVLQALAANAPPEGSPAAVLVGDAGAAVPAHALPVRWGPSPLFPKSGPGDGLDLPRLIPRSYAIGALVEKADLVADRDHVAGALPSREGSAHLEPLARTATLVALQNMTELRGKPREFIRALAGARVAVGPRPLLYVAAVADPASLSLLVYLGADVLDDFEGVWAASAGVFLYNFGEVAGGLDGACHCGACLEYFAAQGETLASPTDEPGGERALDERRLEDDDGGRRLGEGRGAAARRDLPALVPESPLYRAALGHNRLAIAGEARIAARAVREGTLRELVESRVRANPWLVAGLRNLDREFYAPMEAQTPIWKPRLHALSHESLHRPEVRRWGERLRARYRPPDRARVLLLAPCAARKPYSLSKTHRSIDRALAGVRPSFAVHRVVVTSPLGLVPQELERIFPAAQYDIPVTGDWVAEETARIVEQTKHLVASHAYKAVVSLVGDDVPSLHHDVAGLVECAEKGRPWDETLSRAAEALSAALRGERDVDPRRRTLEDLGSVARFQFGIGPGDALMSGATAKGRYPWSRLFAGKAQLAMHVPDRGRLALTLEGARRVADAGAYRVEVEPFKLKGDIFAVGVRSADPDIRRGDSVAVVQDGQVVAAGFARMSAPEMLSMKRGIAVDVRHKGEGSVPA